MTISDGSGDVAATVLSAIGSATGGTVTVTNAINVTGTADEAIVALHDTNTKVEVGAATVTLSDDPDLTELINLNAATTGAIKINDRGKTYSGTAANLKLALAGTVTDGSDNALNGNITLTNGPTATELQTINNGTGGTIVVHDRGITLSGTAAVMKEALAGTIQDGNGEGLN